MKKILVFSCLLCCIAPVHAQTKKAYTAKKVVPATSPVETLKRGKVLYQKFCISCHQVDGGGVPNLNPPIVGTSRIAGKKAPLIKVILNGMQERVEIDGEFYSNNMPPFKTLTDQQVADVLTYIRKSFGNTGTGITKTEVTMVRSGKIK
ncbi:c-type cytochrome [Niabella aurantiaca]|uniref:c-type cytochrome n=1 Tax=Niabella aurantiaca TaxID=379900 RepID=UPI000477FC5F|nr:cytochrome c [Niabella aurantiaca]